MEDAIIASSGQWPCISRYADCLISSRSGMLSLIQSARLTASAILGQKTSRPSLGNRCSYKPGSDRRAFSSTSFIFLRASGSVSKTLTSQPISKKRATQPPPITPPPMTANCIFFLVMGVLEATSASIIEGSF